MTSLSCFADYEITAKYEKLVKSQYCTTLMCSLSFKISIKRYTRNVMLIKGMYLKKGLWSNIFQLQVLTYKQGLTCKQVLSSIP